MYPVPGIILWPNFSIVLSSLGAAARRAGHDLHADVAALHWLSFLINTALVLLQFCKPDLEEVAGVYLVETDGGMAPPSGWQPFGRVDSAGGYRGGAYGEAPRPWLIPCCSGSVDHLRRWLCCCPETDESSSMEYGQPVYGAWLVDDASGASGTLNDALLGTAGLGGFSSVNGDPIPPAGRKRRRLCDGSGARGCWRQTRALLRSLCRRGAGGESGEVGLARQGAPVARSSSRSPFPPSLGLGDALTVRPGPDRSRGSAYPTASGARAPPQAAVPVLGISVTRSRLVDPRGVPLVQRSLSDSWTEHSLEQLIGASFRSSGARGEGQRAEAEAEAEAQAEEQPSPDGESDAGASRAGGEGDGAGVEASTMVEFELAVRTSGRGEMDWWGQSLESSHAASRLAAGPGPSSVGDWRVWRSAREVLALYDALALRFGQDFSARLSRPQLKTAQAAGKLPAHRLDISRDARTIGAFLRSLLGQRQFLR